MELSSLVVCAAADAKVTIQSVQKTAETAALETIASMQVPNPCMPALPGPMSSFEIAKDARLLTEYCQSFAVADLPVSVV